MSLATGVVEEQNSYTLPTHTPAFGHVIASQASQLLFLSYRNDDATGSNANDDMIIVLTFDINKWDTTLLEVVS